MSFRLELTVEAREQLKVLEQSRALAKQYKAISKTLGFLSKNPRHPGLQTHKYTALAGPDNVTVCEAYAEQNTPAAWRVFWCYYPPGSKTITVLTISGHP